MRQEPGNYKPQKLRRIQRSLLDHTSVRASFSDFFPGPKEHLFISTTMESDASKILNGFIYTSFRIMKDLLGISCEMMGRQQVQGGNEECAVNTTTHLNFPSILALLSLRA